MLPTYKGNILLLIGSVQFIVLSILSMSLYVGGYDFWGMAFSGLGAITVDGVSNMTSAILFAISVIVAGVFSFICWYGGFKTEGRLSLVTTASMLLSVSLIGIGITPGGIDVAPWGPLSVAHSVFVVTLLLSSIVVISIYVRSSYSIGGWYDRSMVPLMILLIITVIYTIVLFYSTITNDHQGFAVGIVIQKFVIYGLFAFFLAMYAGWIR